jgi:transcriptional regulator with XRE-family HTH domain
MLNAEQIRAARALLDWSTKDLAKMANLTVNGINKIERGHVIAQQGTQEKLQEIFENAGVEFLPNSGLRKRDRMIQAHEGEDANRHLLDDVYNTLKDSGGEILISHVDEGKATESVSKEFLDMHLKRLEKANIKERMLIRVGDTNLITDYEAYRAIPDKYYVSTAMFIYGDKLGLASWLGAKRSVIVHDALFAESARRLFNFVWDHAQVIQKPGVRTKGHK